MRYDSFEAFRSATGAETLAGEATGWSEDPELVRPGAGTTLDDSRRLPTLTVYSLQQLSPLIDRGVDPAKFGVDAGDRDFFGESTPTGRARDVGVSELR